MIIQDPATGNTAAVDDKQRLQTRSVTVPVMTDRSHDAGESFVFASGDFINITTVDTETGFLYIKNNSTSKDLHIQSIRTCGTQTQKWKLYSNVTAGTLVSGAVAGSNNNLNLGSSVASDVTVYKGADATTITDGTMMEHWINEIGHSKEDFQGALILGPSDTIAITVETAIAGDFCSRIIGYRD